MSKGNALLCHECHSRELVPNKDNEREYICLQCGHHQIRNDIRLSNNEVTQYERNILNLVCKNDIVSLKQAVEELHNDMQSHVLSDFYYAFFQYYDFNDKTLYLKEIENLEKNSFNCYEQDYFDQTIIFIVYYADKEIYQRILSLLTKCRLNGRFELSFNPNDRHYRASLIASNFETPLQQEKECDYEKEALTAFRDNDLANGYHILSSNLSDIEDTYHIKPILNYYLGRYYLETEKQDCLAQADKCFNLFLLADYKYTNSIEKDEKATALHDIACLIRDDRIFKNKYANLSEQEQAWKKICLDAIELGNGKAMYDLAKYYYDKDSESGLFSETAEKYLEKAKSLEVIEAYKLDGLIYEEGKVRPKDLDKAIKNYEYAGFHGLIECYTKAGYLYHIKSSETMEDSEKAIYYRNGLDCFMKAAKQNDPIACYNVAICYLKGYGVPLSTSAYKEGIKWLEKAVHLDYIAAIPLLEEIKSQIKE